MPTWTNTAKQNNQQATAGLYIGFGLFTYSGGQQIGNVDTTDYTNGSKNEAVWIPQDRN